MAENEIRTLLDRMTLAEQVGLLSGEDFWSLPAIERLGVGKLRVTDGPNGARGTGSLFGSVKSAAFPVGIALGATFDVALLHEIGEALAEEVKSKGAHVSLAPTVNLHRSVTNGRNFECYSEDPILSAELSASLIRGLQSRGVGATVKHFVGNESEIERTTMSSEIDERTLRELYLVPFEWAVRRAGVYAVMSSYNRLNGVFTSENHWLLTTVLRDDWGFDGAVMSDWFGSHSTAETVNAGLDLEMPGPPRDRGDKLVAAVERGEVARETVRNRAGNVLRLMQRTGALHDHRPHSERSEDRPELRALIRRAGAAGTVLLRNDGVLPLSATGRVAVIGPNARTARIMGGGSAQLDAYYRVSPFEGLAAALGADRLVHVLGCTNHVLGCTNHRFEPVLGGGFKVDYFPNATLSGEPAHTETQERAHAFWMGRAANGKVDFNNFSARFQGSFTPTDSGLHRVGIHSAGFSRVLLNGELVADAWSSWKRGRTFFEGGCDEVVGERTLEAGRRYEVVVEFASPELATLGISAFSAGIGRVRGDDAIEEAVAAAREAETAVVCVGRTGEWDTEGSDLTSIRLPGRQDELVAAVADANPRTVVVLQAGGPVEMPWLDRVAAVLTAWYPGQEAGNAIADVLVGAAEPGGRLPQTFPARWSDNPTHTQDPEVYPGRDGKVRYDEGLFTGYRHYDRHRITPLFPFGFGLSYTEFTLADIEAQATGSGASLQVSVDVTVRNVGAREGSEVVQLYVAPPTGPVDRPDKELKAFEKVVLAPGESRRIPLRLDARSFAYFDTDRRRWVIAGGTYSVRAARNASDDGCTTSISLPASELPV